MRVVIALGGNAIAAHGAELGAASQRARVAEAVAALADIARVHDVVITHGNGPQVGLLALQAYSHRAIDPYPLDVLGAETEGQIGYLLESELAAVFPSSDIATLLTQVEVDAADPAFLAPTKPIGPVLDTADARDFEKRLGWSFAPAGTGLRRLVPSPEPRHIREIRAIELLIAAGVLVICAGGGGIPVVCEADGAPVGVEAVVDKDLTAALLARQLGADSLLLLTDVPCVYADWPTAEVPIGHAKPEELRAMDLEAGSMAPKVEAACRFADAGGRAAIGRLEDARDVLAGSAGTQVGSS
jgi:carbamate kinase